MGTIMQFAHTPTFLPSNEYRRLQRLMLTMIGRRTALASVLRRKLGSAGSALPSAARDVAVSGKRVRFRVDGQHVEERILGWEPPRRRDTVHLSLLSPRGLALLGLGPGEAIAYRTATGRTEFLAVEQVFAAEPHRPSRNAPSPLRDILDVASIHFTAPDGASPGGQHA
jgi:transcription elongation GreA/GreB family factor